MLCDSMVAQDIHAWERKCTNNERYARLQDLSHKMQKRVRLLRQEVGMKLNKFQAEQDEKNYKMSQDVIRKLNDGMKTGHKEGEELRSHFMDLKKDFNKR